MKHNQFFEKVAKIFGAELDELAYTEDIPHDLRTEAMKKYYKAKSEEAPTSLLEALSLYGLGGAGVGGLAGAFQSDKGSRLKHALIGAGVGGLMGATVGALARSHDKDRIEHAKSVLLMNKGNKLSKALEREAAIVYGRRKEARRLQDRLNEEQRHRELVRSIRGRD